MDTATVALDLLKKIYEGSGLTGILITLVVLTTVFGVIRIIEHIVVNYFKNKKIDIPFFGNKKTRHTSLKKHPAFQQYDRLINFRAMNLQINCPLRKKIFTKLLVIKMTATKSALEELVNMKEEELSSLNLRELVNAAQWKAAFALETNAKQAGLPDIAISRFKEKYDPYFEMINNTVLDISTATIYGDNIERLNVCIELIVALESTSLVAIEQALDSLNGELSKVTFEGTSCLHCNPCKAHLITHPELDATQAIDISKI